MHKAAEKMPKDNKKQFISDWQTVYEARTKPHLHNHTQKLYEDCMEKANRNEQRKEKIKKFTDRFSDNLSYKVNDIMSKMDRSR